MTQPISSKSTNRRRWSTYSDDPLEALECFLSGATEIGWWSSGAKRANRYLTAKQLRRLVAAIRRGAYDAA
jgi:hypothetical protein